MFNLDLITLAIWMFVGILVFTSNKVTKYDYGLLYACYMITLLSKVIKG